MLDSLVSCHCKPIKISRSPNQYHLNCCLHNCCCCYYRIFVLIHCIERNTHTIFNPQILSFDCSKMNMELCCGTWQATLSELSPPTPNEDILIIYKKSKIPYLYTYQPVFINHSGHDSSDLYDLRQCHLTSDHWYNYYGLRLLQSVIYGI